MLLLSLFTAAVATTAVSVEASSMTAEASAAITALEGTPELAFGLTPSSNFWPKFLSKRYWLTEDEPSAVRAVAMLNVPFNPSVTTVSTATITEWPSELVAGPTSHLHDDHDSVTSAVPALVSRDRRVAALNWATIQKLRQQIYHGITAVSINRFLETKPEFKKYCLAKEDCSLALGSIPNEETMLALRSDLAGLSPNKECDELCVIQNLDVACSNLARNGLTRVALIRNHMMSVTESDMRQDDPTTYDRISLYHRMSTSTYWQPLSTFRREKDYVYKFNDILASYNTTVLPPTIGRVSVPTNRTFLETLLHDEVCSGDEFICNHDPMHLRQMVGLLHAAMDSGILSEDSVFLQMLLEARRGTLSQPGQFWGNSSFATPSKDNAVSEAIKEVKARMNWWKPVQEAMRPSKFYWTETLSITDGRTLTPTLILDKNRTSTLHPALKKQGYAFFQSFYGGHAFLRQAGSVRSTFDDKWQPLSLGTRKNGTANTSTNSTAISPASNSTKDPAVSNPPALRARSVNTTFSSPANSSASHPAVLNPPPNRRVNVRYTTPINEAEYLNGSLRGKDMPAYYPTDNRTSGSRKVQYQIRSGGINHTDSLGRPMMRAYILGGHHPPLMMSGDSVPFRTASTVEMRFSQPVLKRRSDVADPDTPEMAFNTSDPAASYVRVTAPIIIDEVFVCAARAQQQLFWAAPHSLNFGRALVLVDGSELAQDLSEQAKSRMLAVIAGDSLTYANAENAWKDFVVPASMPGEGLRPVMNISRLQAIVTAYDAGYNVTRHADKSKDTPQKDTPQKDTRQKDGRQKDTRQKDGRQKDTRQKNGGKKVAKRNSQQSTGPAKGDGPIEPPDLTPPTDLPPEIPPANPAGPEWGYLESEAGSSVEHLLSPSEYLEEHLIGGMEVIEDTYGEFLMVADSERFIEGEYGELITELFGQESAAGTVAESLEVESISEVWLTIPEILGMKTGAEGVAAAAGAEGAAAGAEGVAAGAAGVAAGAEGVAAGAEGVAAGAEGVAAGAEGMAAAEGVAVAIEAIVDRMLASAAMEAAVAFLATDPLTAPLVPIVLGIGALVAGLYEAFELEEWLSDGEDFNVPNMPSQTNTHTFITPPPWTGHALPIITTLIPPRHSGPVSTYKLDLWGWLGHQHSTSTATDTALSRHLQRPEQPGHQHSTSTATNTKRTTFSTSTVSGLGQVVVRPDTNFITVSDISSGTTVQTAVSLMTVGPSTAILTSSVTVESPADQPTISAA
ncbi:unnamed protein product [Zymoseptoria tritici ST99CH_3D1]|nr:unnamed protein product [Zymoseptoria tritici ST99CH_3D1]